jgi:hypothetical protein
MENTSGKGSHAVVPKEAKGWNWRAFLATRICRMKKISLLLLVALFLLASVPSEVKADGLGFQIESTSFALHDETAQVAAINYENGQEKLLLAVKFGQLTSGPVLWIVPVPARAPEVKIDVCQEFPELWGADVLEKAEPHKRVVEEVGFYVAATQIFPMGILVGNVGQFIGVEEAEFVRGVEVYTHLEREGITAEVVTAETGPALDEYLQAKKVAVPSESIPVIDEYIGKNYSFVVSWIEPRLTEDKEVTPAIFVEFPANKLYYPLKLTSAYGDRKIPLQLIVIGYVKPSLYPEIEKFTKCRYFEFYWASGGPAEFYGKAFESYQHLSKTEWRAVGEPARFTTIEVGDIGESTIKGGTPAAKSFVDDLWMERLDDLPAEVKEAINKIEKRGTFFGENWLVLFIPWLICLSLASGSLAGLILYRKPKKFALIGLTNCFTQVGLIIATILLAREEGKRVKFLLLFWVFFLIFDFALVPALRYLLFL